MVFSVSERYGCLMRKKRYPKEDDPCWGLLASRFQSGIKKLGNGCWVCVGAENQGNGYTRLTINRKPFGRFRISTHRLSFQLHKGPIPDGLCVCHECDNPPCCNPKHLFLGTHARNADDRKEKGRGRSRERHPRAKLTEAQVAEIRRSYPDQTQKVIAKRYGITQAAVSLIITDRAWSLGPRSKRPPITSRNCSVLGCRNKCRTHGMCISHHRRWVATGTTDAPVKPDAHKSLRMILVEKFVSGIEKHSSGCWTCSASDYGHESGYGRVGIDRAGRGSLRDFTHRISYRHFKGPIPKTKVVRHRCDNRRCCNPGHLVLGSQAQNMRDMVENGRSRFGARHHNAMLSEALVAAIRIEAGAGTISQRAIGLKYGVSQTTISGIALGKRWKHSHQATQD